MLPGSTAAGILRRGGALSRPFAALHRKYGGPRRSFHVAIIGSGPAGFYTAGGVLDKIPGAKVDMYETLPVPFGLIRFGIAPDHPEIEQTSHTTFDKIGRNESFRFIGNVSVESHDAVDSPETGRVDLATVLRHYDAVAFAYGAAQDKKLNISGESLAGVFSARQFVAWYNGLPGASGFDPSLDAGTDAVIIGQGNVALDVARMLLKSPRELEATDISEEAIDWLLRSRINRVSIVGRRGLMQAAFTTAEVKELCRVTDAWFRRIHDFEAMVPNELLDMDSRNVTRRYKKYGRLAKFLQEMQARPWQEPAPGAKQWSLDFCLSPNEFCSSASEPNVVRSTRFERTELSSMTDAAAQVTGTGKVCEIPSSVVFRSIGYKSTPLRGFEGAGIPFDQTRGVIKNDGTGRIVSDATGKPLPGLYCSGWVKTGPTGIVAHTMAESILTAEAVAQDARNGRTLESSQDQPKGWEAVKAETPDAQLGRVVGWDDWLKINEAERERGTRLGKPRRKFQTTAEMLSVLE